MAHTLIFSDIHVHPHKRKIERLEDCIKTLDWVFQTAIDRNIKEIIFGGDLLHERQRIDTFTYMRVWETLEKYMKGDLKLYLLLGNHDMWYATKWNVSSIRPFSALPGVEVVDKPSRIKIAGANFDFIPYTHDPIAALKELKKLPGQATYAVGHIALTGAKLNTHGHAADVVIEHDGDMVVVDPKIFKDYEQVFLGHYHCAQVLCDNVEYVGSPLELSFGEAFQKKHIIDFDASKNEKVYIENKFSPKHLYIKQSQLDKYDLTNNFICILADDISAADVVQMREDLLKEHKVGSFQIRQANKKEEDDSIIVDAKAILMNEDEMLDRYMKEIPPPADMDAKACLEFGKKIITAEKKIDITI